MLAARDEHGVHTGGAGGGQPAAGRRAARPGRCTTGRSPTAWPCWSATGSPARPSRRSCWRTSTRPPRARAWRSTSGSSCATPTWPPGSRSPRRPAAPPSRHDPTGPGGRRRRRGHRRARRARPGRSRPARTPRPRSASPAAVRRPTPPPGWPRSGWTVTLVGAVGDDDAGRDRLAELRAAGRATAPVRARRGRRRPARSSCWPHDGERTMISRPGREPAADAPRDVDAALAAAPDAGHLHLSGYTLLDDGSRGAGLRALAAARERGLTTSVDAASAAPLRRVGAAAFLGWVRGRRPAAGQRRRGDGAGRRAGPGGAGAGAVGDGSAGGGEARRGRRGLGRPHDAVCVAPARRVAVVDRPGAGDAFAAGLLAAWLAGATPTAALSRATDWARWPSPPPAARPQA